jgi:hypothetical protein
MPLYLLNGANTLSYDPNRLLRANRSIRQVTSVSAPLQRGKALTAAFVVCVYNI